MKRLFFVVVALLLVIMASLLVKPSNKTEPIVMGVNKKPIIFNIY